MGSILVEKLSVCLVKFDRVYKVPTVRVYSLARRLEIYSYHFDLASEWHPHKREP